MGIVSQYECNFVCCILMAIYLNLDMYREYSFIANLKREICIQSHTLEIYYNKQAWLIRHYGTPAKSNVCILSHNMNLYNHAREEFV